VVGVGAGPAGVQTSANTEVSGQAVGSAGGGDTFISPTGSGPTQSNQQGAEGSGRRPGPSGDAGYAPASAPAPAGVAAAWAAAAAAASARAARTSSQVIHRPRAKSGRPVAVRATPRARTAPAR
jgi:hypothetical protein